MSSTTAMLEESILATQQQKSAADQVAAAMVQIRESADQLAAEQEQRVGTAARVDELVGTLEDDPRRRGRTQRRRQPADVNGVHVRLRVGGESYAFAVENVLEVAELGDIAPVPGFGRERSRRAATCAARCFPSSISPPSSGSRARAPHSACSWPSTTARRAAFAIDEVSRRRRAVRLRRRRRSRRCCTAPPWTTASSSGSWTSRDCSGRWRVRTHDRRRRRSFSTSSATRRTSASTTWSTRCSRSRAVRRAPRPSTRCSATPTRSRAAPECSGWTTRRRSRTRSRTCSGASGTPESSRRSSPTRCFARPTRCAGTWGARARERPICSRSWRRGGPTSSLAPRRRRRRRRRRSRPGSRTGGQSGCPPQKIDRLLDLVGETVLHRRRLEHVLGGERIAADEGVSDELDLGDRLFDELKDAAIQMRTLPHLRRSRARCRVRCGTSPRQRARTWSSSSAARTPSSTASSSRACPSRLSTCSGMRSATASRARRSASEPASLRARRSSSVPSSAAGRSRSWSPTTAAACRRRCSHEAKKEGSLANVLARPGFTTADEVTELSGSRCRPRRREAPRRVVRRHVRGVQRAGQGHADRARASARARAARGTPRGARRAGVRRAARGGGGGDRGRGRRSSWRARRRSSCAAARCRSPTSPRSSAARRRRSANGRRRSSSRPAGGESRPRATGCSARRKWSSSRWGRCSARVEGYLGGAILGDGRIALLLDPAALTRAKPPRTQTGGHAGSSRAARAEGARRRGLVHGPCAAAQHSRGCGLSRWRRPATGEKGSSGC